MPIIDPFRLVREYLKLDDKQTAAIVRNNAEYSRFRLEKEQRIRTVQREIYLETGKSPLDPAALGLRYAEIESICRHVRDETQRLLDKNQQVLTDAQKRLMKGLEDALKLYPVIMQAQQVHLMPPTGLPGLSAETVIAAIITDATPNWSPPACAPPQFLPNVMRDPSQGAGPGPNDVEQ